MRVLIKLLIVFATISVTIYFMHSSGKESRLKLTNVEKSNIGIKGSFMIAAIGKDGIIIATETRGVVFDKRDNKATPIGYYDGIQKEFIIGNTVIANTGNGAIGNMFFSALIKDFNDKLKSYPSVYNFFNVFRDYCNSYIPKELHGQIESNLMLAAGFQEEKPVICCLQHSEINCIESEGYIESDITIFKDKYTKNLSCDLLAELAKEAIKKYSEQKDNWKTIGGEVSIVKITKADGPTWMKKISFRKWIYTNELIKDYNEGNININLIKPFKKEDLDRLFNDK